MISAMPTVNPSITGSGTSEMKRPARTRPADDEDESCKKRRQQQPVETKLSDDRRNDDDEGARRTAYLNPAPAEQRNEESANDCGDQTGFRRGPGRNGYGNAEWQRDERDCETGERIAHEQAPGIIMESRQELGLHRLPLS